MAKELNYSLPIAVHNAQLDSKGSFEPAMVFNSHAVGLG